MITVVKADLQLYSSQQKDAPSIVPSFTVNGFQPVDSPRCGIIH